MGFESHPLFIFGLFFLNFIAHISIYMIHDKTNKKNLLLQEEMEILKNHIEASAIKDPLTGLYNRRYYQEVIAKELNRIRRNNQYVHYLLINLDLFKPYNDFYGHQQGDALLKQLSKLFHDQIHRADDLIFRIGPDEFVLLFSTQTKEDGHAIAEGIVDAVFDLNIEHHKSDLFGVVTISAGLMTLDNSLKNITEERLYNAADKALLMAKEKGRNYLEVGQCVNDEAPIP
jgi:diguanylate cyclase (GGDEF)-like protein